jgi:hypothetical protein
MASKDFRTGAHSNPVTRTMQCDERQAPAIPRVPFALAVQDETDHWTCSTRKVDLTDHDGRSLCLEVVCQLASFGGHVRTGGNVQDLARDL